MSKKKLFLGVIAGAAGFWVIRSYLRSDGTRKDTVAHMKDDVARDVHAGVGLVKRWIKKIQTSLSHWARQESKSPSIRAKSKRETGRHGNAADAGGPVH